MFLMLRTQIYLWNVVAKIDRVDLSTPCRVRFCKEPHGE